MAKIIIHNHGFFHYMLDDETNDLEEKINDFKQKNFDVYIEILIISLADTLASYLYKYDYKNYNFRLKKYDDLLSNCIH